MSPVPTFLKPSQSKETSLSHPQVPWDGGTPGMGSHFTYQAEEFFITIIKAAVLVFKF
jgi:hypothetical protein